ncbi:MAG TPA: helix-turn-helix transcriptional regulator [Sphaerochaeta sp.]|jgi:y4mF family transcriptional regulator|nr:helix-turn-helix transcriptional regulator [Sphaerochaeta sp.]HQB54315.1 helix-turn-helix transcriptional regulator [Sphaerochaeta sp.]
MNELSTLIREYRKQANLTQEEFALLSGLGVRFVRELEQGKPTVRLDKVNQALALLGFKMAPVPIQMKEP